MEKAVESRYSKLKKSFLRCSRDVLFTTFPFEEFSKAFPTFTSAEKKKLYQLYVQVITSLHGTMQDNFDILCHEAQVGTTLDTVEHLVEQQSLDPLFSKKTNLIPLKHDMLAAMENEAQFLEGWLDKVEDQKHKIKTQVEFLKKKREESEDTLGPTENIEKLRSVMIKYGSYSTIEFNNT